MAIIESDLHWLLSTSGASEGGAHSATDIVDAVDENLFSDISDGSRIAGGTEIRKLFLLNENGVDSLATHSIWCYAVPTNATPSIGLGVDSADDADPTAAALTDFGATAKVALSSDGADTRTIRIRGLSSTGDPLDEDVVLTGASEVLSVATFSSLYAISADAVSASRTITIKQGTGGTTRGQIPIGFIVCFRWLSPASSKATGLHLTALVTGSGDPIWTKLTWTADVSPVSTELDLRVQTL